MPDPLFEQAGTGGGKGTRDGIMEVEGVFLGEDGGMRIDQTQKGAG